MIWNHRKQLCPLSKDKSIRLEKWAKFFSKKTGMLFTRDIWFIYIIKILLRENITINEKQPACMMQTGCEYFIFLSEAPQLI